MLASPQASLLAIPPIRKRRSVTPPLAGEDIELCGPASSLGWPVRDGFQLFNQCLKAHVDLQVAALLGYIPSSRQSALQEWGTLSKK